MSAFCPLPRGAGIGDSSSGTHTRFRCATLNILRGTAGFLIVFPLVYFLTTAGRLLAEDTPTATGYLVKNAGKGYWHPASALSPVPCLVDTESTPIQVSIFDTFGSLIADSRSAGVDVLAVSPPDKENRTVFLGRVNGVTALYTFDAQGKFLQLSPPFSSPDRLYGKDIRIRCLCSNPELYLVTSDNSYGWYTLVKTLTDSAPIACWPISGVNPPQWISKTTKLLAAGVSGWQLFDLVHQREIPLSPSAGATTKPHLLSYPVPVFVSEANRIFSLTKEKPGAVAIAEDGATAPIPAYDHPSELLVNGSLLWFTVPSTRAVGAISHRNGNWKLLTPFLVSPLGKPESKGSTAPLHTIRITPIPDTNTAWVVTETGTIGLVTAGENGVVLQRAFPEFKAVEYIRTTRSPQLWKIGTSESYSFYRLQNNALVEATEILAPFNRKVSGDYFIPNLHSDSPFVEPSGWLVTQGPGYSAPIGAYLFSNGLVKTAFAKTPERKKYLHPGFTENVRWAALENGGLRKVQYKNASNRDDLTISIGERIVDRFNISDVIELGNGSLYVTYSPLNSLSSKSLIIIPAPKLTHLALKCGGIIVPLPVASPSKGIVINSDKPEEMDISLDWPGISDSASANGRVAVKVTQRKTGNLIGEGQVPYQARFRDPTSVVINGHPTGDCELTLEYIDDNGSDLSVRWPAITFQNPSRWYQTPWKLSVVAWLTLLGLVLFCRIPILPGIVQRFAPLLLTVGASAGGAKALISKMDGELFIGLMIVSIMLLIVGGWIEPSILRLYAGMSPFDTLLPFGLRWRHLRRRVYANYISRVRRELREQCKLANNEHYAALPVKVQSEDRNEIVTEPNEDLLQMLTGENSVDVLLSAPGGSGKSALVRAIVTKAIEQFELTGKGPLPILVDRVGKLQEIAVDELLGDRLSTKVLEAQLARGDWFFAIDGLSELGFSSHEWKKIRGADGVEQTRILASTRTDPQWEHEFCVMGRATVAYPQRLERADLEAFQCAYEPDRSRWLSESVLDLCSTSEGGYLPILIRLALNVVRSGGEAEPENVCEIYRSALRILISSGLSSADANKVTGDKNPGKDLLERSRQLCLASHWENGRRTVATDMKDHVDTIKSLHAAGILVPAERSRADGSIVKMRFFHDSMQSFLTAEAALRDEIQIPLGALLRSAGEEMFREFESISALGRLPELFRMALAILEADAEATARLAREMRDWTKSDATSFGATAVRAGCDEKLRERLPNSTDSAVVLSSAIDESEKTESPVKLRRLANLYSALAPIILKSRKAQAEELAPVNPEMKSPLQATNIPSANICQSGSSAAQ